MATWELIKDGTVVSSNDTGIFKISDPVGTQYTIRNTVLGQEIPYTRELECCSCNCNQLRTTNRNTSYNYNRDAHASGDGVLLKELIITDSNFNCFDDVKPYAIDAGITKIWAVRATITEYYEGGVERQFDGIQIRGYLSSTSEKRALRFGLKVCDIDCRKIFYVYQRCYCGMDDCLNEYTLPDGSKVYEDHPMYISGCLTENHPTGTGHSAGDSCCVESLYCTARNLNGTETRYWLIKKENGSYVSNPAFLEGSTPIYTYNENGDRSRLLLSPGEGLPPVRVIVAYISAVPELTDKEKVWHIKYESDPGLIVGGSDAGQECCEEFTVTLYQAPYNKQYDSYDRDENNKRKIIPC